MLMFIKGELQVYVIPTGKRSGGLTNILFPVVANAHGEELHDLPGKIFIRRSLDVHSGIKKRQHCGILRHRQHELVEITGSHGMEELQFLE